MRIKAIILSLSILPSLVMAAPAQLMEAHKKNYTVGITQIVEHPVLTKAYQGIIAGLKEEGYQTDTNLKIIYKNAQGSEQMAKQIAQEFVELKVDLMMPISTASAQAVLAADKKAHIPVVFSAVTDPVAAQLVPKLVQPGGYVTGVYDFPPVLEQVKMLQEFMPDLKTLGVLYNPQEINSASMVAELKKSLPDSVKIIFAHVNASTEVPKATQSLTGKVEAIYIPADNTVVAQIKNVLTITDAQQIPVFTSEAGSVEQGALAALAYDQYEVGYLSGRMAGQILHGKNPGTMDVVKPANTRLWINAKTAAQFNIQIPENMAKSAEIIS